MGNSQSKYKPTERELCDKLKNLTEWEEFAIFLPGIIQAHINEIKRNNPSNVKQQKQALFDKWLRVCPKACWNDVILALEKVDENTIVAEIMACIPNRESSPDEIFIPKGIVEELSKLHDEFCSLSIECEESLKELVKSGKVSLKKLINRATRERAFNLENLSQVETPDDFIDEIKKCYDFINHQLLVSLANYFLVPEEVTVVNKLHKYVQEMDEFMCKSEIKSIKYTLRKFLIKQVNDTPITILLQNSYGDQKIWLVHVLLKTLFNADMSKVLKLFRVEPGSVTIVLLAPQHLSEHLIELSECKKEFMKLVGVISLQIGHSYVFHCEENEDYTFEASFVEAKKADNQLAVQYLLHEVEYSHHEGLSKAVSEGSWKMLQANILLCGPSGTGKSSLKRVILGQPKDGSHDATCILENAVLSIYTEKMEIVERDELVSMLADVVQDFCISKSIKKKDSAKLHYETSYEPSEEIIPKPLSSFKVPKSSSSKISTSTPAMLTIRDRLKNAKPSTQMFNSQWHHVVDCGGLPQFHDVLPLVYCSPSIYVVVIRLTEGLDDKTPVCFYKGGKNVYPLPDSEQLSNREYITMVCQQAASCTDSKFVTPFTRVMIVGTHKDKLGILGVGGNQKIAALNQSLKDIRNKFMDVLICKSAEETIFDVDTMATGKNRQKCTEELQKHIFDAVQEGMKSQYVPLNRFVFQLDLENEDGVVKMEKCIEAGQALGMNEADVKNALMYLNKAALLMYFPDHIPDLILTKVEPLIERLSQLLKASFIPPVPGLASESTKLRENGLFNKSFLAAVCSSVSSHGLPDDEFLKILECLKIAVQVEGEDYFLPSALSFEQPSETNEFKMSCIPLAFSWGDRILPHSFFFTVAVELLGMSSIDSEYSFRLCTGMAQWREEIQLSERNGLVPGVVKLTNRISWIQVSYSGSLEHCPTVNKTVDVAVQKAIERFRPHTGIEPPTVECLCPLYETGTKDHYCILTPDKKGFTCSIDESKTGVVTENMLCWFGGSMFYEKAALASAHMPGSIMFCKKETKRLTSAHIPGSFSMRVLPPIDDTPLEYNSDNLLAVLHSITEVIDWFTLGLALGLPIVELKTIKMDEHYTIERRRRMVSLWLETGEASWNALFQALTHTMINRNHAAYRIAVEHPPKETEPSSSTSSHSATVTAGIGPRHTPQLRDVYYLLKPKSYDWHVIGGHLGVDFGFRESLRYGGLRTNDNKLEVVLNNWIETHCSEVSWDNLIQVLTELEFIDIVRDVRKFLQRDQTW